MYFQHEIIALLPFFARCEVSALHELMFHLQHHVRPYLQESSVSYDVDSGCRK